MKPQMIRWPRSVLAAASLAVGCAKVLGFDEPTAVACVSSSDCSDGQACVEGKCQCLGDCGSGGQAGTGAEGGTPMNIGPTAGKGGSGAGDSGKGGTGGGSPATGGSGDEGGGGADGGSAAMSVGGDSGAGGGGSGVGGGGSGVGGGAGADGGVGGSTTGGSGGDSGAGAGGESAECDPEDTTSCFLCDETGHYMPGSPCDAACKGEGVCAIPNSCNGMTTTCAGRNCCLSLPVLGESFLRSCDYECQSYCPGADEGFPATVSSLFVDAFEVTVGRFRRFVVAYPGSQPDPGAGANPRNSGSDGGWQAAWSSDYLPTSQDALKAQLLGCDAESTWTNMVDANEELPINCVSWYVAQAFCIWDGGRLPTEAEWNLVAAGGAEGRVYPWSTPPADAIIDNTYAVYQSEVDPAIAPAAVGSRELGRGRWGHYDLAGNLSEWVWDGRQDCYPTPEECNDCGFIVGLEGRVVRGGAFAFDAEDLKVEIRGARDAVDTVRYVGFRCARDL